MPLPVWATVLAAAESWGEAPWKFAGGDPLTWFIRWQEYKTETTKKALGIGMYKQDQVNDG